MHRFLKKPLVLEVSIPKKVITLTGTAQTNNPGTRLRRIIKRTLKRRVEICDVSHLAALYQEPGWQDLQPTQ